MLTPAAMIACMTSPKSWVANVYCASAWVVDRWDRSSRSLCIATGIATDCTSIGTATAATGTPGTARRRGTSRNARPTWGASRRAATLTVIADASPAAT
ncbi:Uncharacterised protein [Mycobacteroides abscessus]|nr:Uncharacterised protein [Mycobacteroides abscessus]